MNPTDGIACLECMDCGEVLRVAGSARVEELQNALAAFMAEHVDRHGTDPLTARYFFRVPRDFDGELLAWPKERDVKKT